MKTFTLNGKLVPQKEITFNTVVDWEDLGISLDDLSGKPLTMMRAYVAYAEGISMDEAGVEINEHIANGGSVSDIATAMNDAFKESGFFRGLSKGTQKETRKSKA